MKPQEYFIPEEPRKNGHIDIVHKIPICEIIKGSRHHRRPLDAFAFRRNIYANIDDAKSSLLLGKLALNWADGRYANEVFRRWR